MLDFVRRSAAHKPPEATRLHGVGERITRPLALQTGAVGNAADAVCLVVDACRRRR